MSPMKPLKFLMMMSRYSKEFYLQGLVEKYIVPYDYTVLSLAIVVLLNQRAVIYCIYIANIFLMDSMRLCFQSIFMVIF